jgi:hypothetical protein
MNTLPVFSIKATDYIGDSLSVINSNFASLNLNTQDMNNRIKTLNDNFSNLSKNVYSLCSLFNSNFISTICQLRVTCSKLYMDSSFEERFIIKNAQSIFIHPVKQGLIGLYDNITKTWETQVIPGVLEFSTAQLSKGVMYDIYLGFSNIETVFVIKFEEWSENKKQKIIDGVIVSNTDNNMRYIGCLYKENSGIEQSYTQQSLGGANLKQHIWNSTNQINCFIKGTNNFSSYSLQTFLPKNSKNLNIFNNTDGNKTFWNQNNSLSFICNEKTSVQVLYNTYIKTNNKNAYIGISINDAYKPIKDNLTLVNQNSDGECLLSCSMRIDAKPGLNKIYTFDAGEKEVLFNTKANSYFEVNFLN